jgi:hypothetical protein
MKLQHMIRFAGIGWLAGALLILLLGFVITPATIGSKHSIQDPIDQAVLGMVLLGMTPGALLGGILGGRMSYEGGGSGQLIMAGLIGLLLSIPFGCIGFWFLGW